MATLSSTYKGQGPIPWTPVIRNLPNGGGSYQAPVFGQAKKPVVDTFQYDTDQAARDRAAANPISNTTVNPEYIKPDGTFYTAKEVVANRAAKLQPVSAIPKYAGDSAVIPDQTVADMNKTNTGMTNASNDIATGTTDPYGVASKSGIAYSPAELKAIEKAYAGIYDPALTDIHTKLKARADLEKTKIDAQIRRDEIVFNTNENIRQWRATTGSKSTVNGEDFSPTQIHKGASNAGVEIDAFNSMDPDVKNYFINPPSTVDEVSGKTVKKTTIFDGLMKEITDGTKTHDEVAQLITDSTSLPAAVKTYYINHLPLDPVKQQGYFGKIWGAITGQ